MILNRNNVFLSRAVRARKTGAARGMALFLTLAVVLRVGAQSNGVFLSSGPTNPTGVTNAAESPAAVPAAYQKLLAADNTAQSEVDRWIQDNQRFVAQGGGLTTDQLRLKIQSRFAPVRKGYEEFLKAHPDHVGALLAYGSLLNDLNDEVTAALQWERARDLAPTNPAPWNNLGNHYAAANALPKAFEHFEKAIALAPQVPVYRRNLGSAIVHFRTNAMTYYATGEQAVLDKGLRFMRQAQKLEPDDFPLATEIAQTYYGLNPPRVEEAIAAWNFALKLAADDVEREGVHLHLARVNLQAQRLAEARHQLDLVRNEMYDELKRGLAAQIAKAATAAAPTNAPSGAVN
jgi:tetratricopeptide (TPR) repeat protein